VKSKKKEMVEGAVGMGGRGASRELGVNGVAM